MRPAVALKWIDEQADAAGRILTSQQDDGTLRLVGSSTRMNGKCSLPSTLVDGLSFSIAGNRQAT